MSDTLISPEVAAVGDVVDLDPYRARTAPVSLAKDNAVPAPVDPSEADTIVLDTAPADVDQEQSQPAGDRKRARRLLRAARRAHMLATHERTCTALKATARHSSYVVGGAGVVAKKTWHGRTVSEHHRMRALAIAAGNHELAADWQDKADKFRADRHRRRMELIQGVPHMAKSAAIGTAGVEGALLLLGACMAIHDHQWHDVVVPTLAAVDAIRAVCWFVGVAWGPALALMTLAGLSHLWKAGQKAETSPAWAKPASTAPAHVAVTPSVVVKALADLGIAALKKSIKDMADGAAGMLGPITLAGCGVEVDVLLPSGACSTADILSRRRRLAENLGRHEHELHMSIPPAARTVRMWIADSGALDEPIGLSPLITDPDMTADMWKGLAPWGQDLRGDGVMVSLWQRHMLITGLSNQGKTASLRALALWLAFDPRVKFRMADFKGVGDWLMFKGIAEVLIEGPTDEHVIEATHMLEATVKEMQERGALMNALTAKGWSQEKILADPRFDPIVCVIDEAQVAYSCGARETFISESGKVTYGDPYGGAKNNSRYFQAIKKIHDQGRAVNVTTWEGTQNPTDQNLPVISRDGNHIRAGLVLSTESQSAMALGEAPVEAGAAPHKLRQGLDKGTCVVAGDGIKMAPGQASITVRTHYISTDDAKEIAERAKARRAGVETKDGEVEAAEEVDHLVNALEVLGDGKRVQTSEVLRRLITTRPAVYRGWELADLTRVLTEAGAEPVKTRSDDGKAGVVCVSTARVMEAIEMRGVAAELDAE
ncbi:MAG: ATP-binding protein [Streptomycetaceae bacterium]|nr:ATP-binding protein [Streptomycetaceae bacterium]